MKGGGITMRGIRHAADAARRRQSQVDGMVPSLSSPPEEYVTVLVIVRNNPTWHFHTKVAIVFDIVFFA